MSSGSLPCENSGQRPTRDSFAQLLVGQGAMSQLMIQMAQEMNRRAAGGSGDPFQTSGGQGNNPGTSNDSKKEMRMDEKWIPAMPAA